MFELLNASNAISDDGLNGCLVVHGMLEAAVIVVGGWGFAWRWVVIPFIGKDL